MILATIVGIDPGSYKTGYGILKVEKGAIRYIESGVLEVKGDQLHRRLASLSKDLRVLFDEFKPSHAVVEKAFLGKNVHSAFVLGQVRGLVLCEAYRLNCEVFEFAAREVKKGITGYGQSDKSQVAMALFRHLGLKAQVLPDASDGLALALHFATRELQSLGHTYKGIEL